MNLTKGHNEITITPVVGVPQTYQPSLFLQQQQQQLMLRQQNRRSSPALALENRIKTEQFNMNPVVSVFFLL